MLVRVLGKRTTGQMNNFDWIITITIGAIIASGILQRGVAIVDALIAIVVLAFLQWATTKLVLRSRFAAKLVKARPELLVHRGRILEETTQRTRISDGEIYAALRGQGITQLKDVNWVILETNGTMSVIANKDESSLEDVATMPDVSRPKELSG